jgi:hypothetical protein
LFHTEAMQTVGVDPRDETWELADPRYRVYFWAGTASDEWKVSGADVHEVLAWAEANRGDRTYTLYACVPQDGLGLVRLAGEDPTLVRSG